MCGLSVVVASRGYSLFAEYGLHIVGAASVEGHWFYGTQASVVVA